MLHLLDTSSPAAMADAPPVKSMAEIQLMKVGTKKELQALVFAAEQVGAPKLPSDGEERRRKESEYQQLLSVDGDMLPDPFSLQGWMKEEDALNKWPPTMMFEIAEYLRNIAEY